MKRKFSSFFKSLVIELDKDLYGPDNHLVEWHRTPSTQETDGFQVNIHFQNLFPDSSCVMGLGLMSVCIFIVKVKIIKYFFLVGEATWGQKCTLYDSSTFRLPTFTIQIGLSVSSTLRSSYADQTRHHCCSLAIYQNT